MTHNTNSPYLILGKPSLASLRSSTSFSKAKCMTSDLPSSSHSLAFNHKTFTVKQTVWGGGDLNLNLRKGTTVCEVGDMDGPSMKGSFS